MLVYRVSDFYADPAHPASEPDVKTQYLGTFDACRKVARATERGLRGAVFVELLDYPTDKTALLALLNGHTQPQVVASWRGTVRGGLQLAEDNRGAQASGTTLEDEPHLSAAAERRMGC